MYPEKTKKFDRDSAIKTTIKEVTCGDYVQEGDQSVNYLLTKNGQKLFRVNITAAVLHKEIHGTITNTLIDDGSEKIILRSFEENKVIREITIGDVVLIIGRVRVYNKEKYLSPEIVKRINPLWLKVRSLELKNFGEEGVKNNDRNQSLVKEEKNLEIPEEKGVDGEFYEDVKEDLVLPVQKLRKLIAELDDGNGVSIEEVIEKSLLDNTDDLIKKMLENGDIFQNTPGKVKVL